MHFIFVRLTSSIIRIKNGPFRNMFSHNTWCTHTRAQIHRDRWVLIHSIVVASVCVYRKLDCVQSMSAKIHNIYNWNSGLWLIIEPNLDALATWLMSEKILFFVWWFHGYFRNFCCCSDKWCPVNRKPDRTHQSLCSAEDGVATAWPMLDTHQSVYIKCFTMHTHMSKRILYQLGILNVSFEHSEITAVFISFLRMHSKIETVGSRLVESNRCLWLHHTSI